MSQARPLLARWLARLLPLQSAYARLAVVPGSDGVVIDDDGALRLHLSLTLLDIDGDLRDVMDAEVLFVPAAYARDLSRVMAYAEGWGRVLPEIISYSGIQPWPDTLVDPRVLYHPGLRTADDFAAALRDDDRLGRFFDRTRRHRVGPDAAALRALCGAFGLGPETDSLLALAREGVAIVNGVAYDHEVDVGVSKLDGLPDLPPETPWPGDHRRLVAQFDLASIARACPGLPLPTDGVFYCFHAFGAHAEIGERDDTTALLHVRAPSESFKRRDRPAALPAPPYDNAFPVGFRPQLTLPPITSPVYERAALGPEARARVAALLTFLPAPTQNRLLGHPTPQDRRFYQRHPWAASDAWRLLLQVETLAPDSFEWGNGGQLSLWIPADALARSDLSTVRAVISPP